MLVLILLLGVAIGKIEKVRAATTQDSFISCNDISITESDKVANFTVTINSFTETEYTYKTVDDTATSVNQSDYTYSEGSLVFDNNDTRQHMAYVSVPITDDTVPESTESFGLEIYSNIDGPYLEANCTATIFDDDPEVVVTPVTTPTPPAPIQTPNPTPTPTPPPTTITPVPPRRIITPLPNPTPDPIPVPDPTPTQPQVLSDTQVISDTKPPMLEPRKAPERAVFVKSVGSPKDIGWHAGKVIKSAVIAALLILLIMFPADLFNSTLQSNYDEVVGWFKLDYVRELHRKLRLHRMPIGIVMVVFGGLVTLLNVQLSPGLGFNRASGALLLGMFIALSFAAAVYDLSRSWYLKKRFGVSGKLRTHALGLGAGALFVTVSRLAHFVPGYLYGLFTGLIFKQNGPTDKQDGEGLALASVVLLSLATIGWFVLIPVRSSATQPNASFVSLVAESALASLWVSALGTIVFSLAPLRFMYGEQVKKWNKVLWAALWGTGMLLFVYTLLDPNQGIYNKSGTASWISVLSLFIGFGIFSFGFWGYFRYRPVQNPSAA